MELLWIARRKWLMSGALLWNEMPPRADSGKAIEDGWMEINLEINIIKAMLNLLKDM